MNTSVVPSILVWFTTCIAVGPAMIAATDATLLDRYPYLVGAVVGSAVLYPLVLWRAKRFPAGEHEWVLGPLWIAPPLLGLAFAALGNNHLDVSEPSQHPTRLLRVAKCSKNASCAYFASWRGSGEESVRLGGFSGIQVSWDLRTPAPVVVETRPGFFGWEHITAVRVGSD